MTLSTRETRLGEQAQNFTGKLSLEEELPQWINVDLVETNVHIDLKILHCS